VATVDRQVATVDRQVATVDRQVATVDRQVATVDRQVATVDRHLRNNARSPAPAAGLFPRPGSVYAKGATGCLGAATRAGRQR